MAKAKYLFSTCINNAERKKVIKRIIKSRCYDQIEKVTFKYSMRLDVVCKEYNTISH